MFHVQFFCLYKSSVFLLRLCLSLSLMTLIMCVCLSVCFLLPVCFFATDVFSLIYCTSEQHTSSHTWESWSLLLCLFFVLSFFAFVSLFFFLLKKQVLKHMRWWHKIIVLSIRIIQQKYFYYLYILTNVRCQLLLNRIKVLTNR